MLRIRLISTICPSLFRPPIQLLKTFALPLTRRMLTPLVMLRHWARILVTWRHRSYVSNGSIFCRTFARWTRHSPPRPHSRPRRQSWLGGTWLPTQVYPVHYTGQARQGSNRTREGPIRSVCKVGDCFLSMELRRICARKCDLRTNILTMSVFRTIQMLRQHYHTTSGRWPLSQSFFFVSDHVWHVDGLRQRTRQVSYGYYKGLVRDMWWNQLSDSSVFCSNGTMHAIRSGRVQTWSSHRVVLRSLRSLHLLSAGPSARLGLQTVFSILYYYTCNCFIYFITYYKSLIVFYCGMSLYLYTFNKWWHAITTVVILTKLQGYQLLHISKSKHSYRRYTL